MGATRVRRRTAFFAKDVPEMMVVLVLFVVGHGDLNFGKLTIL